MYVHLVKHIDSIQMEKIELDLTGCETRDVYYVGMYMGIMVQTCILCMYIIIVVCILKFYTFMYIFGCIV